MRSVRYNGQYIDNAYTTNSGQIWLSGVECRGNETSITQCRHAGWGRHNCNHSQDVSISCFVDSSTQYAGQRFHCRSSCWIFVYIRLSSLLSQTYWILDVGHYWIVYDE